MKAALSMLLLCGGAALEGCGKDTATSPIDAGKFTITSSAVFVVDDEDGITLVGDADSVLVFDVALGMPILPRGTIIVGTDNGGYIRRVKRTRTEGKRLFVTASSAFLTDAVRIGRVDTTLALGFGSSALDAAAPGRIGRADNVRTAPGVSLSEDGLNLSGLTLFSGSVEGTELAVTITQGRIEFDPVLDLFAAVGLSALTGFHAIAEGRLEFTCDARITASGPVEFAREMPLATVSSTFTQRIGRVPVVVTVTLSYVASCEIHFESAGACELGVEAASRVKFGPRYGRRVWNGVVEASPEFIAHPFLYDSNESGSVRLAIAPRLEVAFYGVPGVSLDFGPHFGLVERDAGFPVLEWETFASIGGAMAVRRGALDRRIPPYDAVRSTARTTLDSGPFKTDAYIFITQWGSEGFGEGLFAYPKGIAADGEGNLYVADNWNNCVQKFTSAGEFLMKWGAIGVGDGQFDSPERIAVDEYGNVYVVDSGNNRVQKFSSEGAFLAKWGSEGNGDAQLRAPVGIAVSGGIVYVADNGNNRVVKFSTDGEFLGGWGSYGGGDGLFDGPMGVAASASEGGAVFVSDCRNDRIQRFSPEGLFAKAWGSNGAGDGELICPVDVEIAPGGTLIAADIGNDRIVQFTRDGVFVTKLGSTGAGEGRFDHPEAVAIDGVGNLYVVDARNRRIQKFAPREQQLYRAFSRESP